MMGRSSPAPVGVAGSILHVANSYGLSGLEMEALVDPNAQPVRFEDTKRPLLLSVSGNASHALLLLPQARQAWADVLFPYFVLKFIP